MEVVIAPGSAAVVEIDYAGVTPTSLSYQVIDENEDEFVADTNVALPGSGTKVTITVPGIQNSIPDGATSSLRRIILTAVTSTGVRTFTSDYVVEGTVKLTVMSDSFMTYGQAVMERRSFGNLPGWEAADESTRVRALRAAYRNLLKIHYRYVTLQDMQSVLVENFTDDEGRLYYYIPEITLCTIDDFAEWPDAFKKALRRAQLVEADNLLEGDPVDKKRREGIVSEKIGESSVFLGTRPVLRLSCCAAARRELIGFTYVKNSIARA